MKLIGGISMVKNSPFKALGKQKQMSMIARVVCNRFKWYIYTTLPNPSKKKNVLATNIQPWKLTWNLNKNHPLEKENHLSNIHFWRSMLIFHGCIAILKNSNCKPSPFKPLKLNCVAGALPRWQINVSLIFQRSCWLVLLHQKYEDVWTILQIHPCKMRGKTLSSPLKILDLSSSLLIISCHRCRHGGVHRVWIASSNGAVWAENWSSCTQAVQANSLFMVTFSSSKVYSPRSLTASENPWKVTKGPQDPKRKPDRLPTASC